MLHGGDWLMLVTVLCVNAVTANVDEGYDSSKLDAALHHYETLHTGQLHHEPHPLPHVREVSFHALDQDFQLQLKPDTRTLAKNFRVFMIDERGHKVPHQENTNNFLHGHVLNIVDSRVTAHLSEDGILSAVIATPTATYHVEPSSHYVSGHHNFHMIVYEQAHVKPRLNATRMDFVHPLSHLNTIDKFPEGSQVVDLEWGGTSARLKRQTDRRGSINGSFCGMVVVGDHTVYDRFGRSMTSASRQLVLIISVVSNEIYNRTRWIVDSSGNIEEGLGLTITEVIIHSTANTSREQYNTGRTDVDASDLLSFMRLEPWQGNCLVHLFTSRNFASGLLGLANIASPLLSQTGGICSTRFRDNSGIEVIYNTGLSTFNNGGQIMVVSEMVRVVGHEIGHNWGSFHDPSDSPECRNFLMNEFAQDGSRPSHSMFSDCSRRAIGNVLLTKAFCFQSEVTVRCGNFRMDEGEQCDAGPAGDSCCTSECMFTSTSVCSDINSPCCFDCQVANTSLVCRSAPAVTTNCIGDTFCTGTGITCPDSSPSAAEGAPCVNGTCRAVSAGSMVTECQPVCSTFCNCAGVDECKVCCEEGGTCAPAQNATINLANGSECSEGICVDGGCSDRTQDNIQRIWEIITSLDSNAFRLLLMENIVGVVLIFSIPVWVILGSVVHFTVDRPLLQRFIKAYEQTDLGKWISMETMARKNSEKSPERQPLMAIREESDDIDEDEEVHIQPADPVDDSPAEDSPAIPRTLV